jgi:hypothetical protein
MCVSGVVAIVKEKKRVSFGNGRLKGRKGRRRRRWWKKENEEEQQHPVRIAEAARLGSSQRTSSTRHMPTIYLESPFA